MIFILIFLMGCSMPQPVDNLKKLDDNPIVKKELEFCPIFKDCKFHQRYEEENELRLILLDTCSVDLKDWELEAGTDLIETGKRIQSGLMTYPEVESHKVDFCFKGSQIGDNVNHYYCNITIKKEPITDESGKILVAGIRKKIGVEYEVSRRNLVNYSCSNDEVLNLRMGNI